MKWRLYTDKMRRGSGQPLANRAHASRAHSAFQLTHLVRSILAVAGWDIARYFAPPARQLPALPFVSLA
jgi:hypothetical protein